MRKLLELLVIIICLAVIAGGIYYLINFRPIPESDIKVVYNAVVITAPDPFQLLVVYPNGQKTGFNPVDKKTYLDIPKSKYYFQPPKNKSENGTYWLGLTDNSDSFTLNISGETNQYYSFGIYVYRNNTQSNATFWGRIISGNTASYKVSTDLSQDFPLIVTQIN